MTQEVPNDGRDVLATWGQQWYTAYYNRKIRLWFVHVPGNASVQMPAPDEWREMSVLNAATPEQNIACIDNLSARIDELEAREARQHVQIKHLNERAEVYDEELKTQRDRVAILEANSDMIKVAVNGAYAALSAAYPKIAEQVKAAEWGDEGLSVREKRARIEQWWGETHPRWRYIDNEQWHVVDPEARWQMSGSATSHDDAVTQAYRALVQRFPEVAE